MIVSFASGFIVGVLVTVVAGWTLLSLWIRWGWLVAPDLRKTRQGKPQESQGRRTMWD